MTKNEKIAIAAIVLLWLLGPSKPTITSVNVTDTSGNPIMQNCLDLMGNVISVPTNQPCPGYSFNVGNIIASL